MLNNLSLKSVYSTNRDDVANDFYIPVLSESVTYKRVSGYFSSAALSLFSKGIGELAQRDGKYQLLISNEISEDDYNLIKKGYLMREQYEKIVKESFEDYSLLDVNQKRNFSNLAYLIERGIVDIKVGFTKEGLFHAKYGIMADEEGNKVYFSGSFNETKAAFLKNFESITIVKSWSNSSDAKTINYEELNFDLIWNGENRDDFIIVKEFNEIVRSTLINYSKGKIIMDASLLTADSLVLYYENKRIHLKDNLLTKQVDETKRPIKKIKRKYLNDEILWEFRDNLDYNDVIEIIELLSKYGEKTEIDIVISSSVTNFIEAEKFLITDISKRGLLIKNQDSSMQEAFENFRSIVSDEVSRNLRTIQSWVSFYMSVMRRVGNFSVPGAGKTAMMYGTYAYLSSTTISEVDQIVVIGPKSSFKSWKDEFKLVFGNKRELKVLDIHSADFRPEMLSKNVKDYNLFLFNYESLPRYQKYLEKIITSRTMLVFDEVHKVKGIHSIKAPIAIEIAQQAKYRYVLTGTPIPNGYQDIWNFLHIMYKNEYKSFFGYSESELINIDSVSIDELNEKLFPFYWRVNKIELNVPAANPDFLFVETATNDEQEVINLLWKKYSHNPFVLYARLIQLSSNPSLLKKNIEKSMFLEKDEDDQNVNNLTFEYNDSMSDIPNYSAHELSLIDNLLVSSKFEKAISTADSLIQQNKVVLIWCIFVDTMFKVVERLESKGYRVALIYGAVTAAKREEIISDFQSGDYDVLVTNPHTLAESVSLHKVCHDALYLESSFNLVHMLQSRDRIHRLGLEDTEETNYYYFFLKGQENQRNAIDQKIYKRLKEKEEIMIDAIEGTNISAEFNYDEKQEILSIMSEDM